MALNVTVQRATDLPDVDTFGKSDPFVKISFQGRFVCLVSSSSCTRV